VHIWKFLLWFWAFLEVPRWILCKIPWLTWNKAQNSRRNFQNVHNPTKNSQIYTIPRETSKYAQNPTRNFQKCPKFLEVPNVILCSFGSSSWDFVHFWKLLVGLCIFENSSWDCVHFGSSSWDFVHFWKFYISFCAGWRFELFVASDSRNQSVCMLQKHVFCREKVKGWNGHVCDLANTINCANLFILIFFLFENAAKN
jgi:hypothetical protein